MVYQYSHVLLETRFCYCSKREIALVSPTSEELIEFLTDQYHNGLGNDSLNTA